MLIFAALQTLEAASAVKQRRARTPVVIQQIGESGGVKETTFAQVAEYNMYLYAYPRSWTLPYRSI